MSLSTPQGIPEDLGAVKDWFRELAEHVRAVDFAAARHLFAEDFVGLLLELAGGGDPEFFVGFDEDGFTCWVTEAEEERDFSGMRLVRSGHARW